MTFLFEIRSAMFGKEAISYIFAKNANEAIEIFLNTFYPKDEDNEGKTISVGFANLSLLPSGYYTSEWVSK